MPTSTDEQLSVNDEIGEAESSGPNSLPTTIYSITVTPSLLYVSAMSMDEEIQIGYELLDDVFVLDGTIQMNIDCLS